MAIDSTRDAAAGDPQPGAATSAEGDGDGLITVEQAFDLAMAVHKQGYLDNAFKLYERVLSVAPDHVDALHFMALCQHGRGKHAEALALLREVVARAPGHIHARNNLGNTLLEQGHVDEAAAMYEEVLSQSPEFPGARANLGIVLQRKGDLVGAEAAFRQALTLDPDHAGALHNLGSLLWDLERVADGLTFYQRALTLLPFDGESYRRVGACLAALGRGTEATAIYRKWHALDPDNQVAAHMVAACSGEAAPSRASDAFVVNTFDEFANSFDVVLKRLEYRAPTLVTDAVRAALGAPAAALDVLDAGAGTGLCGPLLREYAKRLVGVDLSRRMLDKAHARAVYDALAAAELTAYMRAHPGAFDVIASADTLVYFGALEDVFAAAAGALRPAGYLVFTVEHASAESAVDHRLNPHGRYSHTESYVRRALGDAGFSPVTIVRDRLRFENKIPVDGLVVTARKAA